MTDASLCERITGGEATIGIIGLGYVGLPLSLNFTEAGFEVKGLDIDDSRVARIHSGDSYIDDVSDDRLAACVERGFRAAANQAVIADCDVYIIAVPTGVVDGEPDMSAVEAASETVAAQSPPRETLVVVTSTVYPGATNELVRPIVEGPREAPTRFAMVPERLNPGGTTDFSDIPLVVGSESPEAGASATELFETIVSTTFLVDSSETAELTKTLENTYRSVNIALVNELVALAENLNADIWDAIDAAATKPFGFQAFRPGPGVGGHCIPIDPQFLSWQAANVGADLSLLNDAQAVNEQMPALVANRIEALLDARAIELEDASILVLGAAYKPNVGDTRNSPTLAVLERLPSEIELLVADPHVDSGTLSHELVRNPTETHLEAADLVVLLVDHDGFNLNEIGRIASHIFDTKNAMPEDVPADVFTLGELPNSVALDSTQRTSPLESNRP